MAIKPYQLTKIVAGDTKVAEELKKEAEMRKLEDLLDTFLRNNFQGKFPVHVPVSEFGEYRSFALNNLPLIQSTYGGYWDIKAFFGVSQGEDFLEFSQVPADTLYR